MFKNNIHMFTVHVESDEVFMAVHEKTGKEIPNLTDSLWMYRSRITLQDLAAALRNTSNPKENYPLLDYFVPEVSEVELSHACLTIDSLDWHCMRLLIQTFHWFHTELLNYVDVLSDEYHLAYFKHLLFTSI